MKAPDQVARDAIVRERERNVMVVAGAGTGKTKTIIDRAVELLAPKQSDGEALSIQRMAAITFTRRAAGELRFRIREQLLRELENEARRDGGRAGKLRDALGNLDAAFIGTIHGFADRLLRLRPVEAELSPAYALVEDTADLVRETLARLRRGAEAGTLAAELGRFGAIWVHCSTKRPRPCAPPFAPACRSNGSRAARGRRHRSRTRWPT
jgi:ATP-dependent helicase/nuclease subunit A